MLWPGLPGSGWVRLGKVRLGVLWYAKVLLPASSDAGTFFCSFILTLRNRFLRLGHFSGRELEAVFVGRFHYFDDVGHVLDAGV
jgi:hypothetical protein